MIMYTDPSFFLLRDPSMDPSKRDNKASKSGRLSVVRLLLGDPRVDSSAEDNYAIRKVSENGHVEVVRLLL